MSALTGKVALVTGASRGIGEAIAVELARQGASVAGTATSPAGAEHITKMFASQGINGKGFVLNVTDQASIDNALAEVTEALGTPLILVNNAGITQDNIFLRMTLEQWESVINTNLTSIYRLSKACLRAMLKERWGRIINISSIVAVTGNPGQENYCAAKAGMLGFTKSLAQEIASRNITVNAVAPGFIETDMTKELSEEQRTALFARIPLQRLGTGADIAAAVSFLASPGASYITGETIHVNGGMYMA